MVADRTSFSARGFRFFGRKRLLLVIVAVMSCSVFADSGMPESGSLATKARWKNKEVLPSTAWRECASDRDCSTVETTCSGCCDGYSAVNSQFADQFRKKLNNDCSKGYKKGATRIMCDCMPTPGKARCKQHLCSFVPESGGKGK